MLSRSKVKKLSIALTIVWLSCECLAFQSAGPSPEAKQRYEQARKLMASGEKGKALEELKAAIQLSPQFVEAHRDYLDNQRDKAESFIEQYEGYVKQNPDSAVYHYLLGKAYSNANKREKSDAEFSRAFELDPKFSWALLALSGTASRLGNSARSVELLEKASQHAGDSAVLRSAIASNMLSKKMHQQALEEADRSIKIDPQEFGAYRTRWQARLNLTFGDDATRAEVKREIEELEASHGKNVQALAVAQNGYQMLEDEKAVARVKKAILALDPNYYERQDSSFMIGTSSGKLIRLTGANARMFIETYNLEDHHQKIEVFKKLEAALVEDADAKLYAVYPGMLRSYIELKDLEGVERVFGLMAKGKIEPRFLAEHQVAVVRAYLDSKSKLDVALDHTRRAIEQLRQPLPKKEGSNADDSDYAKERAKEQLATALHLQGRILLEKGMAEQAAASIDESVKMLAKEESLFDLGRAYLKLDRKDEAIDALSKAYAYEGKRQQEAKANLQKVYGSRAKARPLDALLSEEVNRHRAEVREAAIAKIVREITKTEAKEAPSFTLTTVAGDKVQLADLRGKVLLLNFWATW